MEVNPVPRPQLFPCADRVKVPQVGADETEVRASTLLFSLPSERISENQERFNREYFKKISADLVFSEDVVKAHASHTLPYNKEEWKTVFKHDKIVKRKKKTISGPVGRYDARTDNKHMPCHIQTISEHRLKPLKSKALYKFHKKEEEEEEEDSLSESSLQTLKRLSQNVFLTQGSTTKELQKDDESEVEIKPKESKTWDAHVLMKLSKNTARWIVSEKTQDSSQRIRLDKLLEGVYGSPSGPIDTLIRDDASVSDLGERDVASRMSGKEGWNKVASRFSAKPREVEPEPLASFYRLPAGVRRHQRLLEKEVAGAINTTARDIKIRRKKPKPPPSLRDVMNPMVGDKMFDTSNQFEQEWLSGAQQLYKPNNSKILLDSGNLYHIQRQEDYPPVPEVWSKKIDKKNKKNVTKEESKVLQQGYKKWRKLPEYVEPEVMNVHQAGYDPEAHREASPNTQMTYRENPSLVKLVDEWRGKWHLGNKWYDSSVEDLQRDLKDINEHVRLTAIATIARAATFRPPPEPGVKVTPGGSVFSKIKITKEDKNLQTRGNLPDELVRAVEEAVHDESHRVCITAAIALYTLNRPNEEARQLLHALVRNGSAPEKWAAAQCLAHAGVCDSYVVGELVNKLFHNNDVVAHEQCLALMAKLSENSSIVHSMVAEQLNSTSWRQRITACKALPRLYGIINKDITNKLCNLMWNDWHKEVRMVAAHTLGKTGHGKEVHHDLRERLMNGSERDRIDSLHKIGHLGIMTARLLPAYLQCFDDPYIAVRIAATNTAGKLELRERQVLRKLLFLTQFDPNWKVKAYAIKALGSIQESSDPIQEAIIWALRFETEPGVRAEACQTLMKLQIKGPEMSAILQDKLLVEPNELVRRKLATALEWMGVSSTGDMEMVQQIKDEVRRLCTRYNIAAKITKNEEWEDKQENHRVLFNSSPDLSEFEKNHPISSPIQTRASTRMSYHTGTTTPNIYVTSEDGRQSRVESPDFTFPNTPVMGEDLDEDEAKEKLSQPGTAKSSDSTEESSRDTVSQRLPSAHSRQGSVRSGSVCSNTSRKTPVEKLEKLIELYEGSCTLEEYEKYVRPEEEEEEVESSSEGGKKNVKDSKVGRDKTSNLKQEINEQSETNIEPVLNEDDVPQTSLGAKVSVESIAISPSETDEKEEDANAPQSGEEQEQNVEVTVSPRNEGF